MLNLQDSPNSSIISSSFSDFSLPSETDSGIQSETNSDLLQRIGIPIEQNLRELLQNVTGNEDLSAVTRVKLRVIARDVSLQYLHIYTPNLTELNLNNSVIVSLRDLGNGLVNLKILRVNQCELTSLDGIFAFQNLEELHAEDNFIVDVSPCSFLPNIKLLNLQRNLIKRIETIGFLKLCTGLKHLILSGNDAVTDHENYREIMKRLLPELVSLDEVDLTEPSLLFPPVGLKKQAEVEVSSLLKMFPRRCKSAQGNGSSRDTASWLTSGTPICGNIAASLRNKYREIERHKGENENKSF